VKRLTKGNEAIVFGALTAGCDAYFGYPITPASEIAENAAKLFVKFDKIFLQAESEIGAINMVFGAASSGLRAMTASSGPGISLKMEGISYLAGAELPCVIADIMRAGPGLGNIGPEQGDYFQVVKGGGHGNYRVIALAPDSVSEMYAFTVKAFELADRYRNPVFVLADATLGQMMEPLEIEPIDAAPPEKPWKVDGTAKTNGNLITSIYLSFDDMEAHVRKLDEKYRTIERVEAMAETSGIEDAEIVLTGYGIVSRILRDVVKDLRRDGIRAGLIRPQTLWPFPVEPYRKCAKNGATFLAVELSTGQFVEDVRLAAPGSRVEFYGRWGGNLPTAAEIAEKARGIVKG
jgi:2-oxoisovalerate ferredoxin oxidoreductase alpha subunit